MKNKKTFTVEVTRALFAFGLAWGIDTEMDWSKRQWLSIIIGPLAFTINW
mgnify:CR=1 FL=1